jgi:metal-sulfur cluster biosynthetic enzyme
MIDFTLRNRRLLEEVEDKEVAVVILDLVIGYGSSMNPVEEFIPTVKLAKNKNPNCPIICFVTGTTNDPQNRELLQNELKKCGVELVYSNAQAAKLASMIIKDL